MPPVAMVTFSAPPYADFAVPFNPQELQFEKQMQFAEIAIASADS